MSGGPTQGPNQDPQNPQAQGRIPTAQYCGETGRNMLTRSQEHWDLLKSKHRSSALWKHCALVHGGDNTTPWTMDLISRHRDPLGRMIREGVEISDMDPGSMLNSRAEWRQPKVARVILARTLPPGAKLPAPSPAAGPAAAPTPPPPTPSASGGTAPPAPPASNVTTRQLRTRRPRAAN